MTYRWEGGKWQVDANHDSIITAGNGGTKPIQASFVVFCNRGAEKYEMEQTLQPDDQMMVVPLSNEKPSRYKLDFCKVTAF